MANPNFDFSSVSWIFFSQHLELYTSATIILGRRIMRDCKRKPFKQNIFCSNFGFKTFNCISFNNTSAAYE